GIVRKLVMIMKTIFLLRNTKRQMPFHTSFFPIFKPLKFITRLYEVLHVHLLKLTDTKDKLTSNNCITEGFPYLSNPKRNLHSSSLLNIKIVYKYTLSSFWAKINNICVLTNRAHLGRKHQIKLTNICPVSASRYWANNTKFFN